MNSSEPIGPFTIIYIVDVLKVPYPFQIAGERCTPLTVTGETANFQYWRPGRQFRTTNKNEFVVHPEDMTNSYWYLH